MSNRETVDVPMGLIDITKELTKLNRNRKRLDEMTDRLQSAMDAKRDVASNYVEQLDSIADKEVEVKLDPYTDLLQTRIASNTAMWKAGYNVGIENGLRKGYDEGYQAGRDSEIQKQIDSMTLGEVSQELVRGGISVADQDQLVDDVEKMIEDKDEDEPDQYHRQHYPANYGGTK